MATKVARRFCPACDEMKKSVKDGPNHILHLLLSIVSGGLWLIVWLFVSIGRPWACDECGAKTKASR